jgi:hypothetical protein
MTKKRKRKAKRVIKIYKQINIGKEVNMEKKKINWLGILLDVIKVVIGAIAGSQIN